MAKRTFTMNGNTYTSMMDIARELGVKRIYTRDFSKYGIVETTGQDIQPQTDDSQVKENTTTESTEEVQQEVQTTDENNSEKSEKASEQQTDKAEKPVKDNQSKEDKRYTRRLGTPEQIKESQDNAAKMTIVEFNNSIKHFSIEALVKMADDAGVNNWSTITNEPIRRMRLLMEIKKHYFPNDKIETKSNSGWSKMPLADLMKFAKSKKLQVKKNSNDQIQRMWVVVALNNAGLKPEDMPQKAKAGAK